MVVPDSSTLTMCPGALLASSCDAQTHAAVRSASVELGQAYLAVAQEAAAAIDDLSSLQVSPPAASFAAGL